MSQTINIVNHEYLERQALDSIIDLMDGEPDLIIDLVDTLVETTPELLSELKAGVQSQDATQIREAAHALKSSHAQLGALNFSELCRQMEDRGKRKDLEDTPALLNMVQTEFTKVLQALDSWKQEIRG
jgi:HPt (histidine-containing phosphotransfer) domain-containing protein